MAQLGSSASAVFSALIAQAVRLAGLSGETKEGSGRAAGSGTGALALPRIQTFDLALRRPAPGEVFRIARVRGPAVSRGADQTKTGAEREGPADSPAPFVFSRRHASAARTLERRPSVPQIARLRPPVPLHGRVVGAERRRGSHSSAPISHPPGAPCERRSHVEAPAPLPSLGATP